MATNKNALIRYKTLDKCFRNPGKRYFINDLIEECNKVLASIDPHSNGISRRQILEDIAFMESENGWAIELDRPREGRRVFYRYTDLTFSINNMPLNEVEISQLQSAIDILAQFKGMPQFEWMQELLPKLRQGLISDESSNTIIDFDSNLYLKGIDHLGGLYNAIFYRKVLQVTYQPYENEVPYVVTLHPYFLKQYNNRWFLFGHNAENNKSDWNLAIDRILSFKEIREKYLKNTTINWGEYFDDIIGVTKPETALIEEVVLRFTAITGKYMETKPLHGSQKSKWLDHNTLEVRLQLIINYEFERLVLSYADSVKVLAPAKLANHIHKRLTAALSN